MKHQMGSLPAGDAFRRSGLNAVRAIDRGQHGRPRHPVRLPLRVLRRRHRDGAPLQRHRHQRRARPRHPAHRLRARPRQLWVEHQRQHQHLERQPLRRERRRHRPRRHQAWRPPAWRLPRSGEPQVLAHRLPARAAHLLHALPHQHRAHHDPLDQDEPLQSSKPLPGRPRGHM